MNKFEEYWSQSASESVKQAALQQKREQEAEQAINDELARLLAEARERGL